MSALAANEGFHIGLFNFLIELTVAFASALSAWMANVQFCPPIELLSSILVNIHAWAAAFALVPIYKQVQKCTCSIKETIVCS